MNDQDAVRNLAVIARDYLLAVISNPAQQPRYEGSVAHFERCVEAWEATGTHTAAVAAITAAVTILQHAPLQATRPDPKFHAIVERLLVGLRKIIDGTQ